MLQTPAKILIVDDDPLVLKTVSRLLAAQGYQTATAESGKKAIELVSHEDFDMVMSDIRMPELDGIETIEIIKKHYEHHGKVCAFMFITGYVDDERAREARRLGGAGFLPKPFEIDDLLATVKFQLEMQNYPPPESA